MGGSLYMPSFPLLPLATTSSTSTTMAAISSASSSSTLTPATSSATAPNRPAPALNQRLSVAYLLNGQDEPTTAETHASFPATFIKQEPASHSSESEQQRQPKRKASSSSSTSSVASTSKRHKATTSSPSSPSASSPPPTSSSSTPSSPPPAVATPTFKGDLSLFPHLQLQLQREQLDPQQHTELVLKVWNRQQQVLKLQQLQQKKQELKAQRLQQRLQRKGGKATASPGSPTSGPLSTTTPTSSTATSTTLPRSPTSATPSADMVSTALPTLDDILNGADAQVDEASDEDSADRKKGKARRRITARQVAVLEQVFAVEPFPGPSTKKVIAKKLGMQERSITIWFQNKRARLKRIDGDSHHGQSGEAEGGRREVTFHNLAVGFDGKLDMLPDEF